MKIQSISLTPYHIKITPTFLREGVIVHIHTDHLIGQGEIAPLPNFSSDTLSQCLDQLNFLTPQLLAHEWSVDNLFTTLQSYNLFPALLFALESALLQILQPVITHTSTIAALFIGSKESIYEQALQRKQEGFTSAKLKVSQLTFTDAKEVIDHLKDDFHLRIDVNRAWSTADSLNFFAQYPQETFDYVEEPFQNPHDLHLFTHPLAVDESYPTDLSLNDLLLIPSLKAIVYKPMIQGGYSQALYLMKWAQSHDINFILSSTFENITGHISLLELAHRLQLKHPLGVGTVYHLPDALIAPYKHLFTHNNITSLCH